MITISDLSTSYVEKITASEAILVVGGLVDFNSYNIKTSGVDITQVNLGSFGTFNAVGSVNTFQ